VLESNTKLAALRFGHETTAGYFRYWTPIPNWALKFGHETTANSGNAKTYLFRAKPPQNLKLPTDGTTSLLSPFGGL